MKTKTLFIVTDLLLYFFAGIAAFFFVMVLFTDAINDFRNLLNYLPLYLTLIVPIYALFAVNRIAEVPSDNLRLRKIKIHSLVLLSVSSFAFIYGFINTLVTYKANFLAGGPSKYFPLSFLLLDLIFILLFVYILAIFKKEKTEPETNEKRPFGIVIADVLEHLFCLFALYFLGTFAFGFYSYDLSLQHVVGTLPTYLLMVVPSAIVIASKLVANKEAPERHLKARLIVGLSGLVTTLVLGIWMYVYLAYQPNFVVDAMTASFALDFAISLNLAPTLLFVVALLPSAYLLATYLLTRYLYRSLTRVKARDDKQE
ncbi:MAG: hypothetical protein WC344_01740 [Bacilli bacterium]|jgi:hypothetical protein